MKTLRNLLLVLTSLIATVAFALTPAERILLFGKIKPVWTANFLNTKYSWSWSGSAWVSSPAGLTYAGQSQKWQFDSSGTLTTAPNNILLNTATLSTQSVTTVAGNYIIAFYGTGSVVLSGTKSATINGTGAGVQTYLAFTATAGTLTATVSGSVTNATLSQVTYETTPRSGDAVVTSGTAFYGPRQDYSYTGSAWVPAGMLVEQASSGNYAKYSQDFSQPAWGKYTSGAATGSISANSVSDPSSTTTGAYISINRAAASEYAEYYQSLTGTAASWTGSFFLKAHAGGDVGKTVSIAAYNGSTVVAGTTVTLTASWVRYSVTGTLAASGSCNFAIGYVASTDYAGAPTQTGAVGFDVAFGQFDNTAFRLSYLPNPTASSPGPSRAADVVSLNGVPLAATKSANGSFIAQTQLRTNDTSTYQAVLSANDGVNFPVPAYWYSTPKHANAYNGSNFLSTANNLDMTLAQRIATAWSASGRSLVASNGSVVSDAYTAFGGYSFNAAYLGGNNSGTTNIINGWLQSVSFYNQRLPDPTLKAKSVVGAPY